MSDHKLPEWGNPGQEPPAEKRTGGWVPGDKPPADWLNWLHYNTYMSLQDHEQRIEENTEELQKISELEDRAPVEFSLSRGTQILDSIKTSVAKLSGIKGRTLVNLLGSGGGFESNQWDSAMEYDTTDFVSGTRSGKIDNREGVLGDKESILRDSNRSSNRRLYLNGMRLLIVAKAKVATAGMLYVRFNLLVKNSSDVVIRNENYRAAIDTTWDTYYKTFDFSQNDTGVSHYNFSITCETSGDTAIALFDDVALYQISAAEQTYIDGLTEESAKAYIDEKYPYVDSMQSVFNPYVIAPGKNLLPPFDKGWKLPSVATMISDYGVQIGATSANNLNEAVYLDLPTVPGVTYTLTVKNTGSANRNIIQARDVNGNTIPGTWTGAISPPDSEYSYSATMPAGTAYIRIYLYAGAAETVKFETPILNIGSEALPFEPQQRSYKFWETTLRSYVDGTAADEMFVDENGNAAVLRKQGFKVLDGSLDWTFWAGRTGFKAVQASGILNDKIPGYTSKESTAIKYDGKVLRASTSSQNAPDDYIPGDASDDGSLIITVANTDSGWGPDYSPSNDEVKAYFYGWRMYDVTLGPASPYNGSGDANKRWRRINPDGTIESGGSNTATVPTTQSEITPHYQLQYQLADPVSEPVESEGEVMLHEGLNQLTMGAGVIVREAAKSTLVSGQYIINSRNTGDNYLEHRASEILQVYKNNDTDSEWELFVGGSTVSYGPAWARIPETLFDPTAAYSVTYFALDMYKLGFAPMEITGAYEGNINEIVNQHTRILTTQGTRLSIVENEYARKQQSGWITPTLLNGWVVYSADRGAEYYKDELGVVRFRFFIKDGIAANGTMLFVFPEGYRPSKNETFVGYARGASSSIGPCTVDIFYGAGSGKPAGRVELQNAIGNVWVTFTGSFRAEL